MNYRTRLIADLSVIGVRRWDALVRTDAARRLESDRADINPFLRYDFLAALHETGCADLDSGWGVEYLSLWRGDDLVAAMPLYRKFHSYGEYVFDWAWADAYRRNDVDYYPKLLSAIPFTPVTGPRLIAVDAHAGVALATAAMNHARSSELSSLHVLFPESDDEVAALEAAGCMRREGVQFHWTNAGYPDFESFVDTLERKRRKNIRAERRKVAEAGVRVRRIEGKDATDADWRFFMRCYANTYRAHYSTPYLSLAFFRRIGAAMPENLLLVIAERDDGTGVRPIASSLVVFNDDTLYGRYWGEVEHVPCLHFECAYYQPLEFCIERGIGLFEGGAQGEHKMARGFLPVKTRSLHWLAHPAFADAVEQFLTREAIGIGHYVDELNERDPFKHDPKSR
ncbi:MAG: GNAT family N-acetyltransferase [Burkholderiaceae bacterium]